MDTFSKGLGYFIHKIFTITILSRCVLENSCSAYIAAGFIFSERRGPQPMNSLKAPPLGLLFLFMKLIQQLFVKVTEEGSNILYYLPIFFSY